MKTLSEEAEELKDSFNKAFNAVVGVYNEPLNSINKSIFNYVELSFAFSIADKYDLFNHHRLCRDKHHGNEWIIYNEDNPTIVVGRSESLPRAIIMGVQTLKK